MLFRHIANVGTVAFKHGKRLQCGPKRSALFVLENRNRRIANIRNDPPPRAAFRAAAGKDDLFRIDTQFNQSFQTVAQRKRGAFDNGPQEIFRGGCYGHPVP